MNETDFQFKQIGNGRLEMPQRNDQKRSCMKKQFADTEEYEVKWLSLSTCVTFKSDLNYFFL